ncbi:FKBP-type peptidyl-prolyl cis-trans isomerase [Acinetobacter sp. ESL0695]|uniref:Peptidyl-prolyl cis-trans isomerase n=1 Tax=Acinetobacter pollinis TaxID=2605270 RepID=A0ABU6DWQ8_9GAMM|nr:MULTISPECIES: FKBP-type peptidyl-prolyl cis-trans isomerase [Acinetobacter]MEB5477863.1 FKBP-type peptidyl-prolyl cis-trans isomerase [Acinetobacter pollinis]WEV48878.1 FKBP-type peptidyl-prolyl cis-trans isomerase [Acinetobacter sp. ESL0695]
MKKNLIFAIFSLSCITNIASATTINTQSALSDQAGYSLGYLLGKNNTEALQGINLDAFIQGLTNAAQNTTPALNEEQMGQVLMTYKKQTEAKEFLELKQQAESNQKLGDSFLQKNMKKSGVITTKTGLQYITLQEGTGISPKSTSTVRLNYEGRLIDGTVFDSSIARQQPVTLQVKDVVTGLAQGLLTMKEGGKSRFFIPAQLGYGTIGAGDTIQPNSTLIFDVELLKVEN